MQHKTQANKSAKWTSAKLLAARNVHSTRLALTGTGWKLPAKMGTVEVENLCRVRKLIIPKTSSTRNHKYVQEAPKVYVSKMQTL